MNRPAQKISRDDTNSASVTRFSLRHLSKDELISQLLCSIQEERSKTNEVLEYLREIDRRMIYAELGYSSLFDFCVKYLSYSEGSAQRRISAMRMIREMPEIKEKIASGEVTLANLTKFNSFVRHQQKATGNKLNTNKKRELLPLIEKKTQKEVEATFAAIAPTHIASRQSLRVLSAEHTEIKMILSSHQKETFDRTRLAISNALPDPTHAEVLEYVCNYFLKKKNFLR